MDQSVNFVKGYGKVNPSEHEIETDHFPHHKTAQKRRNAVVISLTVLLTLIIGATIGALIVHESVTEPNELESAPELIKAVCSVTRYPDACFTNITSINTDTEPDPESIFTLSLRLAENELTNLSSLPKLLISKSNDLRTGSALRDCSSLFEDAASQLKKSVEVMGGEKLLRAEKIGDLKTWISAAMTDQETCVDGLEEMGSTAVDQVRVKMERSKEYLSNSLAILDNISTLVEKFGMKMH